MQSNLYHWTLHKHHLHNSIVMDDGHINVEKWLGSMPSDIKEAATDLTLLTLTDAEDVRKSKSLFISLFTKRLETTRKQLYDYKN